jgi:hypothetical protein
VAAKSWPGFAPRAMTLAGVGLILALLGRIKGARSAALLSGSQRDSDNYRNGEQCRRIGHIHSGILHRSQGDGFMTANGR